ncbi:MAG: hypothetical protein GY816_22275, partial [Cytophagales bacterium]|nr:hypothetical protein [Cytophagales bacterium]
GELKKAIIVAGRGFQDTLLDEFRLCANSGYFSLLIQGYTAENIYYLSPDTDTVIRDVYGNELSNVVDRDATYSNLRDAIEWAGDADELLLYMIGHGSPDIFELNPTKTLNAEDLDKDLDNLQENISGRLILIYDACNSGTFVHQMTPPEGKERIVITSTNKGEDAHFGHKGGLSFSYQFWL